MDPVGYAVGLAADPDDVLGRLDGAVGYEQQFGAQAGGLAAAFVSAPERGGVKAAAEAVGEHVVLRAGVVLAVCEPGELLAGAAGAEPEAGARGDDGQAGDGAQGGLAVGLRDAQLRLFDLPLRGEGHADIPGAAAGDGTRRLSGSDSSRS